MTKATSSELNKELRTESEARADIERKKLGGWKLRNITRAEFLEKYPVEKETKS